MLSNGTVVPPDERHLRGRTRRVLHLQAGGPLALHQEGHRAATAVAPAAYVTARPGGARRRALAKQQHRDDPAPALSRSAGPQAAAHISAQLGRHVDRAAQAHQLAGLAVHRSDRHRPAAQLRQALGQVAVDVGVGGQLAAIRARLDRLAALQPRRRPWRAGAGVRSMPASSHGPNRPNPRLSVRACATVRGTPRVTLPPPGWTGPTLDLRCRGRGHRRHLTCCGPDRPARGRTAGQLLRSPPGPAHRADGRRGSDGQRLRGCRSRRRPADSSGRDAQGRRAGAARGRHGEPRRTPDPRCAVIDDAAAATAPPCGGCLPPGARRLRCDLHRAGPGSRCSWRWRLERAGRHQRARRAGAARALRCCIRRRDGSGAGHGGARGRKSIRHRAAARGRSRRSPSAWRCWPSSGRSAAIASRWWTSTAGAAWQRSQRPPARASTSWRSRPQALVVSCRRRRSARACSRAAAVAHDPVGAAGHGAHPGGDHCATRLAHHPRHRPQQPGVAWAARRCPHQLGRHRAPQHHVLAAHHAATTPLGSAMARQATPVRRR